MSKRAKTGLGSSAEGGKRQKLSFHLSLECFGMFFDLRFVFKS